MKKLTLCLLACSSLLTSQMKAQGGPDAYGYTWIQSTDPGGPSYNWIDITGRAGVQTVSGLADDNSAAGMINLGFNFHYYWTDESQIKVGSNGWLSFQNTGNIASCFPTIPTAGGAADNYLAPLMGDLNFTGAGNVGSVSYWTNSVDSFIISYINVPFWTVNAPGWTGSNSFQVILCKSDSSITYQYANLSGFTNSGSCNDLTVGIENLTGNIGLQVYSDALPANNLLIRFDPPNVPLINIQDVLPRWNYNVDDAGVLVVKDASITLESDILNGGNTDVTTPITIQANIRDAASTVVYTDNGSLPSLLSNEDSIYTFTPWIPTLSGSYSYEVTTTNSQDINPSNNTNVIEMQVVDFCSPSTTLSYVSDITPTGSINWNGGDTDDGVAVYFKPPVYPYSITELQYYITSNVSDGFIASVYDDDGPNGTAGTLLFTTTVSSGSIVTSSWNNVAVSPVITLNNGGYYVAWFQTGTTINIGTQNSAPYSNRCSEILAGSWAQYRESYHADIFIRSVIGNYTTQPAAAFTNSYASPFTYNFTDNSTGPIATWSWDFGDGNTSTAQNPTHTFAAETTYTVCLTTTSPCGDFDMVCTTVNACSGAVINQQPLAAILCEGDTATYSVAASGSGTLTYQWQEDQGSGFVDLTSSAVYSGVTTATLSVNAITTSMTTFLYRCVVTGYCGDATSSDAQLTVNANPVLSISPISERCESAAAFLLDWMPAGGTMGGTGVVSGNFDPAVSGPGTFYATYSYTAPNGCSTTDSIAVIIDPLPVVTIASVSNVCDNEAVFPLSVSPTGGTLSGTGVSGVNFDPSVGAGTYTVTYTYTDGNGCIDSAATTVTVNQAPTVGLTSFANVCANDAAFALSGGSPAGGVYSGTGVVSGNFDPSVSGSGSFTITYTYADANSCSDSAQQSILVDPCVGIEQLTNGVNGFNVYPNPTSDLLTVKTTMANSVIEVYNALGNRLMETKVASEETLLDLSKFETGVYIVRLISEEGTSLVRVIKE